MRNAVVAVLAVLGVALIGVAPAEAAKAKTTVLVSTFNWDNPPFLIGEVKSKKKSCAKSRPVTLYRVRGGQKVKLGTSKTISGEGTWAWIIQAPGAMVGDQYYASVKATNKCAGDDSPRYKLSGA